MLKDIDLKHSSYWLDFSLKLNKKNEKLFSTASIEKRDQPRHQISRTASQQFYHDTNNFLTQRLNLVFFQRTVEDFVLQIYLCIWFSVDLLDF